VLVSTRRGHDLSISDGEVFEAVEMRRANGLVVHFVAKRSPIQAMGAPRSGLLKPPSGGDRRDA
jgi:hypothetical protein